MTVSLSLKSWEKDVNLDGKYDSLHFNIEVPLADSEAIHSVQLLLIFDYQLHVSEILNLDSKRPSPGVLLGLIFAVCHWPLRAPPHCRLFYGHIIDPISVTLGKK